MANIPLKDIEFPGLGDRYTIPQVDGTLTQTGEAADAKVTGEEITNINNQFSEITVRTKNLFEGQITQGFISATTGGDSTSTPQYFVRTQSHIPIQPNTEYTLSWLSYMNRLLLYYYDESKTFLSYVDTQSGSEVAYIRKHKTITAPANAHYLRVCWGGSSAHNTYTPSDISDIQLELGDTETTYEYPFIACDKVARANANESLQMLSDIGASGLNLIDLDTLENGCYYSAGSRHILATYSATDYIDIKGGSTYCAVKYDGDTKLLYSPIIEWYDSNKGYLGWANSTNPVTFAAEVKYCRLSYATADFPHVVFLEADSITDMPNSYVPHDVDVKKLAEFDTDKLLILSNPNYQYACGNIICIGDSLTDGLYVPNSQGVYEKGLIKQNYPYYLQRMLSAELVNAGVNGAPPDEWYQQKFSLYDFTEYDTAIIWLGTNGGLDISEIDTTGTQCYYYKQIIDGIESQNPDIKIVLMTVFITGRAHSESTYPNASTTNTAINTIATDGGYQVIDMSDLAYANHPELHNNISNTHFGKAGNIFIADRVCTELKSYLSANPLRCEFGIMPKE